MYFFLEMTTIVRIYLHKIMLRIEADHGVQTNVMGITAYDWADTAQLESLKFWFYAIAVSIMLTLYDLFFVPRSRHATSQKPPKSTSTSKRKQSTVKGPQTGLYLDLVTDVFDLVIPGSAVGWIALDKVPVSLAMASSSLIAGKRIWDRVQSR